MPKNETVVGWELRPGWQPLPAPLGPGPFMDDEFRALATEFATANGWTFDDVVANGPYRRMGDETSMTAGETYAWKRARGLLPEQGAAVPAEPGTVTELEGGNTDG